MNDKTEICCHISFAHREMRIKNETKSDDECICKKKNTTILFRILFHLVVKSFFSLAKFIDLSVEGLRRIGWKSKLLLNYIAMIVTELAVLMFNSINYLIFSLKSFSNCTYPKKLKQSTNAVFIQIYSKKFGLCINRVLSFILMPIIIFQQRTRRWHSKIKTTRQKNR